MTTSHQPIWDFFGLSYSAYLVLHRLALQEMPVEWQARFVAMLEEIPEVVDVDAMPSSFQVRAMENGKYIHDPYTDYRRGAAPLRAREVAKPDRRAGARRRDDKRREALK